jgi:hypothetical protein
MSDLKVSCAKKGSRAYRKMSHHRGRIARAGASTAAPSIGAGRLGRSAGAGDHDRYRPCRGTPAARARPCAGEPSARSPKAGTRWRSAPRRKRRNVRRARKSPNIEPSQPGRWSPQVRGGIYAGTGQQGGCASGASRRLGHIRHIQSGPNHAKSPIGVAAGEACIGSRSTVDTLICRRSWTAISPTS